LYLKMFLTELEKEKFVEMKTKIALVSLIFSGVSFWLASGAGHLGFIVTAEAQTKTSCDISTYILDQDPNGTKVRTKANKNSKVLETLKKGEVVVDITGYSNGWFEISRAEDVGDSNEVLFGGRRGWIHSSLIGMDVANADPRLYAEPRKQSRILMKLKADESPLKLLACQGKWVKVETGGKTGWLSPGGQCGNPLTTCS